MYSQISKHKKLVENANNTLFEAYEDGIRQVADKVLRSLHGEPVSKDTLRAAIERYKSEVPLGSLPVKEFVQDVLKELGNQVKIQRTSPSPGGRSVAQSQLKQMIDSLANDIPSIVGDSFPDGDPIDGVGDWSQQRLQALSQIKNSLGQYDMDTRDFFWTKVWPSAEKQFARENRVKNLDDFLAHLWDEHSGEHSVLKLDPKHNPWK